MNTLVPVISNLFCEVELKNDCTLSSFCETRTGVVFLELADHKSEPNLNIIDVILLEKVLPYDLITILISRPCVLPVVDSVV